MSLKTGENENWEDDRKQKQALSSNRDSLETGMRDCHEKSEVE